MVTGEKNKSGGLSMTFVQAAHLQVCLPRHSISKSPLGTCRHFARHWGE